jgi:hypothetical protein
MYFILFVSNRYVLLQILTTKCPDFEVHIIVYDEFLNITSRWYDVTNLSNVISLPLFEISQEKKLFYIKQRDDYLRAANFIFDPKFKQNCDWHKPQTMAVGTATVEALRASSLSWTMNPGFPDITNVDSTDVGISSTYTFMHIKTATPCYPCNPIRYADKISNLNMLPLFFDFVRFI